MLRKFVPLTSRCCARLLSSAAPAPKIDKEALMKLRKRTGYSFINCRKALLEFGPERMDEAEKWLKELAKKEGWAKAVKLSSRDTTQGLVGVASSGRYATLVELSCETDFVARGDEFKNLLTNLSKTALEHFSKSSEASVDKIQTQPIDLKSLKASDGKTLEEVLTLAIGKLGENIGIKRADVHIAPEGSSLHVSAHPKENSTGDVSMGRFVSIVALKRPQKEGLFSTEKLANQLCQHIIGMRSETLGQPPKAAKQDESTKTSEEPKDELNDFFQGETTSIDEEETALLRQAFMLNPSQTVYDYLQGHEAQVLDFVRYQLGGNKDE